MHFLDIVNRGYTGKTVSKDDWDMNHVVMPIIEVLEDFELEREDGAVLLHDEEEARLYFEAAVELLLRSGVYNQSTGKVMEFTREEILEAARNMKPEVTVGNGADAYTFVARVPDDPRLPGVVAGNPGCPMTEETFYRTVLSWAKEPVVDMVTCGSLVEVDGFPVVRDSPSEVLALRREMKYLNEICAKVGRPGIGAFRRGRRVKRISIFSNNNRGKGRNFSRKVPSLSPSKVTINTPYAAKKQFSGESGGLCRRVAHTCRVVVVRAAAERFHNGQPNA